MFRKKASAFESIAVESLQIVLFPHSSAGVDDRRDCHLQYETLKQKYSNPG